MLKEERKRVRIGNSEIYVFIYDDESIALVDLSHLHSVHISESEMRDLSKILNDLKSGNL